MPGLRRFGLLLLVGCASISVTAQTGRTVIVQTNSAGDSVHLINPETDRIVGEIPDAEVIHGVAVAPDGSRLYLSNESTTTLDFVDAKTLRITKKIPLTSHPNNVAIRKDGRRLYVAIQAPDGGVDVIDTVAQSAHIILFFAACTHFQPPDSNTWSPTTGGSSHVTIP